MCRKKYVLYVLLVVILLSTPLVPITPIRYVTAPSIGTTSIDYSAMFSNVFILHGPRNKKEVALTFDDGPDNVYTPQILNILKQESIPATFFLVGKRAVIYPNITKKIVQNGHAIGNHSWDHMNLVKVSNQTLLHQAKQADQALYEIIGYHPSMFRPPYGSVNEEVIRGLSKLGYCIVYWSVDSLDWQSLPREQVVSNVVSKVTQGDIILQHSAGGKKQNLQGTVDALPQIIRSLKQQGYQFVTIPQLLQKSDRLPKSP